MAGNKSGQRNDPLPVFCFKVSLDGLGDQMDAFFKSVSGLKIETTAIPVREGGTNDTTFQLVGETKWSPLVLKKGFTSSSKLLEWRQDWLDRTRQKMKRVNGTISQLNTALEVVGTWTFMRAWPTKWEIPELDAAKSEVLIESLELCHEGLTFVSVKSS
jgi:phage tail-like protein